MCEICKQCKCPPGCPNAHEPKRAYSCEICGQPIRIGDKYIKFDGYNYCSECIENMTTDELIEFIGGSYQVASESDIDDRSDDAYEQWRDERYFDD